MQFDLISLCFAAGHGKCDVVKCLATELGADFQQETEDGLTPLLAAVSKENPNVVLYLVNELGVKVNQVLDKYGTTSLHIAAQERNLDMVTTPTSTKERVTAVRHYISPSRADFLTWYGTWLKRSGQMSTS
jgi:hypothetical protein